jgi:NAD(P)-dependent dehydrogenase (short-subunit alcohol dehydrogenase family)
MATAPIALIFGAGAKIGAATASRFASAGYRVATVSRSGPETPTVQPDTGALAIRADLSSPSTVPSVFEAVRAAFGAAPRVVIWNAAALTPPPEAGNMFSIDTAALAKDLGVMVTAPFEAAKEAVRAWTAEGEGITGRRFIYTGNYLNRVVKPTPFMTTLGTGKSGAAYWIHQADLVYKEKDIR